MYNFCLIEDHSHQICIKSALWLYDLLLPFSALNSGCMAEKWLVPRVEGWCCFLRNFPNWESSSGTLISFPSMWDFYGPQGFVTQRTVNYASFYICFALHRKCISKWEAIMLKVVVMTFCYKMKCLIYVCLS